MTLCCELQFDDVILQQGDHSEFGLYEPWGEGVMSSWSSLERWKLTERQSVRLGSAGEGPGWMTC